MERVPICPELLDEHFESVRAVLDAYSNGEIGDETELTVKKHNELLPDLLKFKNTGLYSKRKSHRSSQRVGHSGHNGHGNAHGNAHGNCCGSGNSERRSVHKWEADQCNAPRERVADDHYEQLALDLMFISSWTRPQPAFNRGK
ncbi:hypothetical protein GNI_077180 [Gregarina niphandrodes]|uniref:Uncharacterized protein n=1 Tax=Gregarina niphandrodes TaxID=110365 RepID=A0A023B6S2_GRENI|nr:hypothetical protein GNI_077180 [Gregarina niphandrodes]EZG66712.1 hypothetical protein GNI_077180 [Gregarina niphandrodes]|eukprot:XP_011130517.1 hypothetical protein GNI_077180 [Gregarina niphandrodes]